MKPLIFIFLFLVSLANAETYVQINGASVHDRAGFSGFNYGAGLEKSIDNNWTVAGGWYRNSEYHGSAYVYGRYAIYKVNYWDIGIGVGAVTGYTTTPIAPALFPQVCYSWACALFIPKVTATGANAVGFQLRIPVDQ